MAYGKPSRWPDGEPRNAQPLGGPSDGGVNAKGQAVRHADNCDPPVEGFGWVPAATTGSNPKGTSWTRISQPGTAMRNAPRPGPYTTGDQRGKKR